MQFLDPVTDFFKTFARDVSVQFGPTFWRRCLRTREGQIAIALFVLYALFAAVCIVLKAAGWNLNSPWIYVLSFSGEIFLLLWIPYEVLRGIMSRSRRH